MRGFWNNRQCNNAFLNFDYYEDFCEINNNTLSLKKKGDCSVIIGQSKGDLGLPLQNSLVTNCNK